MAQENSNPLDPANSQYNEWRKFQPAFQGTQNTPVLYQKPTMFPEGTTESWQKFQPAYYNQQSVSGVENPIPFTGGTSSTGFSFSRLGDKISTGFSNWLDQPLTQQPILDPSTNKPTGQMSGSILGDLGTLGQYATKGLSAYGDYLQGQRMKEAIALQRDQYNTNKQLAYANINTADRNKQEMLLKNNGYSGLQAQEMVAKLPSATSKANLT